MKRSDAIDLLAQSKPILAKHYGVTHLALFGSTARDSASAGSDVNVLVAFDGPATSARYFGVQFYLEPVWLRNRSGDGKGLARGTPSIHREGMRAYMTPRRGASANYRAQ